MPNLARLPGIREADVAWGSGLRRITHRQLCLSTQTQNVNARPVGGAASAAVTAWTALTVNNQAVACLGTLVAQVVQATPVASTIQLRVKGFNQFWEEVVEVTPVVTLAAKTNNFVYLAATFAHVVSVEFRSTGLDIAGDTLSLGTRWDWTRTNDATNEHLFGRNLGIAVPLRLSGVQEELPTAVRRLVREYGAIAVAGDDDQVKLPLSMQSPARHASARVACTAPPSNGDTLTIDSKVYTWRTTLTAADGDVLIGATAQACLQNLMAAMFASGGAGTTYGANTVAHPTVMPTGQGQVSAVENLFVAAKTPGALGNVIPVSESSAATGWIGNDGQAATTLGFGVDYPCEVQSLVVSDITGQASAGAITQLQPMDFTCGLNEDGWQGERSKVHILKAASVAQWAVADNVMVTQSVLSAEHL